MIRFVQPNLGEHGIVAAAEPYLKIMAISIKEMGRRFWKYPLSKIPWRKAIGTSLDSLFEDDLLATILHELLHVIDPDIGASKSSRVGVVQKVNVALCQ